MNNKTHILVAGYSRSGTTMFYNMLRHAVDNYQFLDKEVPVLSLLARPENIISKRPLDIFEIDKISEANTLDKDISLIVLIRDLRSLITSYHRDVQDDYFMGYDAQYFISKKKRPLYINPGVIQTHNSICKAYESDVFKNITLIRYEELVERPDFVQEKLGKDLQFTYKDHFSNFHKGDIPEQLQGPLNTIRSVDQSRVEGWRADEHRQRVISQFSRCPELFEILIQYGYESDRSWFTKFKENLKLSCECW